MAIRASYTLDEAAYHAGMDRETLRSLIGWGKLPVVPDGRHAVIRRDALEAFLTLNRGRDMSRRDDVMGVRLGDF